MYMQILYSLVYSIMVYGLCDGKISLMAYTQRFVHFYIQYHGIFNCHIKNIKSSLVSATNMHQWTELILLQAMACQQAMT